MEGLDRDYTHVFFGLVVFAGVIAMLLMVAPDTTQNRFGAATDIPVDFSEVQNFAFSQGDSVTTVGKTIQRLSPDTISIAGEQRTIVQGQVYALDSRRTLMVENGNLYIFDQWDSPTCEGITGQTRATSPGSICCDGESVTLPNCTGGAQEIQCGEKRIYCENGQLKSEVTQ